MTRAEKVEEASRLYDQGLVGREIAEQLDCAVSSVYEYLNDPDLSKARARKDSYRGKCEECGARTDGSNGAGGAPRRCIDCMHNRNAERNDRLREMWEADEPTWYIAKRLGMSEENVFSWIDGKRRLRGEKLALRRLGGSAEERELRHRRLIALRIEGRSNSEIAELVGMASAAAVSQAFCCLRRKGWSVPGVVA